MSALRAAASAVAASADASDPDEFTDLLVELAPEVNQYLDACVPAANIPPNPTPNPTVEQQKAWQDACSLKEYAGQANVGHIRKMAGRIRHKKRRDGNPVSHQESLALAHGLVDFAADQPLPDIAAAVADSRNQ